MSNRPNRRRPKATDVTFHTDIPDVLRVEPVNPHLSMTYLELRASFAAQFKVMREGGVIVVNKIHLGEGTTPDVLQALSEVGFINIEDLPDRFVARKPS